MTAIEQGTTSVGANAVPSRPVMANRTTNSSNTVRSMVSIRSSTAALADCERSSTMSIDAPGGSRSASAGNAARTRPATSTMSAPLARLTGITTASLPS